MSDELREEFEEKEEYIALLYDNPKTLFKTFHDKYVLWLESQLLAARSRVKALEEENARRTAENERIRKALSNIRNGCAFPDTPVEKAICIAIDSVYLDGKIVDAVNDNIDTLIEEVKE